MATRKVPEETPGDIDTVPAAAAEDEDLSFSSSVDDKPKTGPDLYRALVASGFIGGWRYRTDIGDSVAYARALRTRASERLRGQ